MQTVKFSYVYEAVVTVLAVDPKGWPTREDHKVVQLKATKAGKTWDVLARDVVVSASATTERKFYKVAGKPVSKEVLFYLARAIDLNERADPSNDDVYGPGGPKKPGDQWKVNREKLLEQLHKNLKNQVVLPKASDVISRVRLVGARKRKGIDELLVLAVVRVENLIPNFPNVKGTAGTLKMEQGSMLPQNTRSIAVEQAQNIVIHFEGLVKKGDQRIKLVLHGTAITEVKRSPIP
ncbi:MAG: hypothetical protein ABI333_12300 [bacterium]